MRSLSCFFDAHAAFLHRSFKGDAKVEAQYDDAPIAERMAAKAGANFIKVPITSQNLVDAFEETVYHRFARPANCVLTHALSGS